MSNRLAAGGRFAFLILVALGASTEHLMAQAPAGNPARDISVPNATFEPGTAAEAGPPPLRSAP